MKRASWAVSLLLFLGSPWMAQGSYNYYYSQALYPTNWYNWNYWTGNMPPVNCYYSNCGAGSGYGGTGTALYTASAYGARGEVRLTIGRGPDLPPSENYYAFLSADSALATFFGFQLSCSSGGVYFLNNSMIMRQGITSSRCWPMPLRLAPIQ